MSLNEPPDENSSSVVGDTTGKRDVSQSELSSFHRIETTVAQQPELAIHIDSALTLNTILHLENTIDHADKSVQESVLPVEVHDGNWLQDYAAVHLDNDEAPELLDRESINFLGRKVLLWTEKKDRIQDINELIIILKPVTKTSGHTEEKIYFGVTDKNKVIIFRGKGAMYTEDAVDYLRKGEDPKIFLGDALLESHTFEDENLNSDKNAELNREDFDKLIQTLVQ